MKIRHLEKDSLDLEALKDCVRMPGYALIVEKLETMLAAFHVSLETEKDSAQVRFLQGQVDCLRTFAKLPGIIQTEIREKQRKRQTD